MIANNLGQVPLISPAPERFIQVLSLKSIQMHGDHAFDLIPQRGNHLAQTAAGSIHHFCDYCIEIEGSRFLARRKIQEGLELLRGQRLHGIDHEDVLYDPIPVSVRVFIRPFEWITSQVEDLGQPQIDKGLGPKLHGLSPLLGENSFPVTESNRYDLAVIVRVEEPIPRALIGLSQ